MGFSIENGRFLNEDGDAYAYLSDVASWLNYFYKQATVVCVTWNSDSLQGSDEAEAFVAYGGDDTIAAGDDL